MPRPSFLFLLGLAALGAPGRELAHRLDLVLSLGPRAVAARLRTEKHTSVGDATYRRIWQEAADEVGAALTPLPDRIIELRRGERVVRVRDHVTPLDDPKVLAAANEKAFVYELLRSAALPVPEHVAFEIGDLRPALALLATTGEPLVVKPVSSSFGSGVTGGVCSASQLPRAAWRASRHDTRMLAERQIAGDVYRLLFLDGRLIDIIRRREPSVIGDGVSTIFQLVVDENRRRRAVRPSATILRLDLDAVFALSRQHLTPRSVPGEGRVVTVKNAVSQNSERENETVRTDVSALVRDVKRACALIDLRLIGVDVITPDPTRSLSASGGVILELNGNPGLHYHYDVATPARATRVAAPILEALLS